MPTFRKTSATLAYLVFISLQSSLSWAEKYTPDHPVVQEMVRKGIGFLNSKASLRSGEGISLLVGYTIFKVESNPEHPLVAAAIEEAKSIAKTLAAGVRTGDTRSMYVPAVAGMLLASVDIEAYGTEVRYVRDFMIRSQKPHGGFGYLVEGQYANSGDISQTQYVMLCLWTFSQLGIEVPDEAIANCVNFLILAQTNDGGWPYQAGAGSTDATATNSLAAAGFSALLIAGDMLGLYRSKTAENQEEEGIIPTAFKRVVAEGQRKKLTVDRSRVDATAKKGENWHNINQYKRASWHYYYLYSRERYESFLEITKGTKPQKSPDWYNQAVEVLQLAQSPSGSFGLDKDADSPLSGDACTAFAILFLIRSTQKAIGTLNEAYYVGNDSLPDDLTNISSLGGKVVQKTATTSIDDALKMLEKDGKAGNEGKLVSDKIPLSSDPKKRKEELNRFVRLLNAKDAEVRRIAAKLLGRGDDLEMVPALIYALSTDPDSDVARIAERSLRLISRQLDTYHLPRDASTKISDQAKTKAGDAWKKWYLSLRPDYVFSD